MINMICLSYFTTAKITFTSILYRQFTHVIFIIYIHFMPNHIQLFPCAVLNILCHHLLSIRVCDLFFTTNLNRQTSEQVGVLRDGSRQLCAHVLLSITARSQPEMSTVAFCRRNRISFIALHFRRACAVRS